MSAAATVARHSVELYDDKQTLIEIDVEYRFLSSKQHKQKETAEMQVGKQKFHFIGTTLEYYMIWYAVFLGLWLANLHQPCSMCECLPLSFDTIRLLCLHISVLR